jgi:predicted nucleotidyltransferase
MELTRVIQELRCVAKELSRDFPKTRWYLFGSLLQQKSMPSDIDLLIVYQSDYEARGLRIGLDALCGCLPIDLLLLREDEESELNFVSRQSAICIFPFEPFN